MKVKKSKWKKNLKKKLAKSEDDYWDVESDDVGRDNEDEDEDEEKELTKKTSKKKRKKKCKIDDEDEESEQSDATTKAKPSKEVRKKRDPNKSLKNASGGCVILVMANMTAEAMRKNMSGISNLING
jgi:hypothetical protein